jgi:hypothetical protein
VQVKADLLRYDRPVRQLKALHLLITPLLLGSDWPAEAVN